MKLNGKKSKYMLISSFQNYQFNTRLEVDRIVENVSNGSNVSMCRNCKVTFKVKFLAYDIKCSLGEGLNKDAL